MALGETQADGTDNFRVHHVHPKPDILCIQYLGIYERYWSSTRVEGDTSSDGD